MESTRHWPLRLAGAEVVLARDYLVGGNWAGRRGLRVYNLCRTYGYQTIGYYVSLLAAARGHRPLPTVETLQDLRLSPVVRIVSEQLEELIQRSLARLQGDRFELSHLLRAQPRQALRRARARALRPVPDAAAARELRARRAREWQLAAVRPDRHERDPRDAPRRS